MNKSITTNVPKIWGCSLPQMILINLLMQFAVFINIHIKLLTSVQMYDKLFYYEKEFLIRSCLFAIGKRTNGGKSTS